MNAFKIETYGVPTLSSPASSRKGGLMEVTYLNKRLCRVVQRIPNPVSSNLAWLVISDATMTIDQFETIVLPATTRSGGTLVETKTMESDADGYTPYGLAKKAAMGLSHLALVTLYTETYTWSTGVAPHGSWHLHASKEVLANKIAEMQTT